MSFSSVVLVRSTTIAKKLDGFEGAHSRYCATQSHPILMAAVADTNY